MERKDEILSHYGFIPSEDGEIYTNGHRATDTLYSDRMRQEDSDKFNKLCMKHWRNESQSFDGRYIADIELFINDWLGKKVMICAMFKEILNNGYPVWRFDYKLR